MADKKPLHILLIGCDWKNVSQDLSDSFIAKLKRDRLGPDFNYFFHFAWSDINDYQEDDRFKIAHVKTRWQKFKPLIDFLTLWFAPWYIKKYKFKPDVVLIYDLGHMPAAKLIKRMYKCKIILGMLNMPSVYSATRKFGLVKSWYSTWLEKKFIKYADCYYTINGTMKNYLIKLGAPVDKIFVFYSDTISRELDNVAKSGKNRIRQKYNIKEDQKIILSIGRLEEEKNYPELFQLFFQLDKKFVLIVLGRGHLLGRYQELSKQLGIADRVFFGGYANRQEIWDYYQDADLFILLSKAEALGLVFWEAMYMGVPVIGSTAEGIAETISSDGNRGFIYDSRIDNTETFKKKIDFCINISDARTAMLRRARQYVEEQMANKTTINDLVD